MNMDKNRHFLRITAKGGGTKMKQVEFPIDEATENWLLGLQRTDDETSDFIVRGNGVKLSLSIVNKGFEF